MAITMEKCKCSGCCAEVIIERSLMWCEVSYWHHSLTLLFVETLDRSQPFMQRKERDDYHCSLSKETSSLERLVNDMIQSLFECLE